MNDAFPCASVSFFTELNQTDAPATEVFLCMTVTVNSSSSSKWSSESIIVSVLVLFFTRIVREAGDSPGMLAVMRYSVSCSGAGGMVKVTFPVEMFEYCAGAIFSNSTLAWIGDPL